MTRKDYRALAAAILGGTADAARECPSVANIAHTQDAITARIADVLAADNPRFDRAMFFEAAASHNVR